MEINLWMNQYLKRLYETMSKPILKKYNLSKIEMDILLFIANNPSLNTARDITEVRLLKKSNVSTAIDDLIQRNYLYVKQSDGDKRIQYLYLDDSTKELIAEVRRVQNEYKRTLVKGFTEGERLQFQVLSNKMVENINQHLKEIEDAK